MVHIIYSSSVLELRMCETNGANVQLLGKPKIEGTCYNFGFVESYLSRLLEFVVNYYAAFCPITRWYTIILGPLIHAPCIRT